MTATTGEARQMSAALDREQKRLMRDRRRTAKAALRKIKPVFVRRVEKQVYVMIPATVFTLGIGLLLALPFIAISNYRYLTKNTEAILTDALDVLRRTRALADEYPEVVKVRKLVAARQRYAEQTLKNHTRYAKADHILAA